MIGSHSTRCVAFETGVPAKSENSTPWRVMTAISSSPRNTTSRVWLRIAGVSDATKNSFSPIPTTIGGPLRTAMIFSGSSVEIATNAKSPRMCRSARRAASSSLWSDPISCSIRCAMISVSVSVTNVWPQLLQLVLQVEVVLDDAVVHDDDLAGAVLVRMGVLFSRPAVRGPARVADAVDAFERLRVDRLLEVHELARASAALDLPVADDGDARRVVTAIFEPPQSVDEDGHNFLRAEITDDSAHTF